tara:strand:- start:24235 stop:24969 length:735 start_codon:yes stop_codon:yes gene_type:complete
MANRVTLAELQCVVDPLITSDDFVALANRAVARLYARAATPSDSVIFHFGTDAVTVPSHSATAGGADYPDHVFLLPATYSHALKFKIVSGSVVEHTFADIVNSENLNVIPLESIFGESGYDDKAFVDYGQNSALGGRIYAAPQFNWNSFDDATLALTNVYALARIAYVDVSAATDTFPFDNIGAMKMACLATEYEDENDMERAQMYWGMAVSELNDESARFRGPQKINVSFNDAAAYEVTDIIN